jgi:hypothetical protein
VVPKAVQEYTTVFERCQRRTENVLSPEKDRVAAKVMKCWADFQEGLSSDKRKYPLKQFRAFWTATKHYAELAKSDSVIHLRLHS